MNVKTGLALGRVWHLIDAKDQTLGNVASRISIILRGKYKPHYNPSVDNGDYVVVINAQQVHLTGKKFTQKKYHWHTGWAGGLKSSTYETMLSKNPVNPLRKAVYGMLPKNRLRNCFMHRLKVFPDEEHPFGPNILKSYDESTSMDKLLEKIQESEREEMEMK